MEIGKSRITNFLMKSLSEEIKTDIDTFVLEQCQQSFFQYNNIDDIKQDFDAKTDEFIHSLNEDELLDLRSYTGYNFKFINAILRGNWNYEEHGLLNDQKKIDFRTLADSVNKILSKFPKLDKNIVTYRGTTLDSFKSYGINTINDLIYLKDNFIYEQGFTSTSIIEDTCYFNKNLDDGKNYNVEVRYYIPSEYEEGALLTNYDLSYSFKQNEFVLGSGSLSKVVDVQIDQEQEKAILSVIVVPEKLYKLDKESNYSR